MTILTNAISTPTSLASVTRTASTYKCTTVESTINTLSTIAQNAITDPASLAQVTRTRSGGRCNNIRYTIDTLI